jgi:hypothetical protein
MYTRNINMDIFVFTYVLIWKNVSWSIIMYLEMQLPYLGVQFQSFILEESCLLPDASFEFHIS